MVPHAPLVLTNEYMDKHGIDMVVRGDDQLYETSRKSYGVAMDRNAFSTVIYFLPLSLHVLSYLFCSAGMTQGGPVRRRPSHGAALSSSLLSVRHVWPQRGTIFDTSHRI